MATMATMATLAIWQGSEHGGALAGVETLPRTWKRLWRPVSSLLLFFLASHAPRDDPNARKGRSVMPFPGAAVEVWSK